MSTGFVGTKTKPEAKPQYAQAPQVLSVTFLYPIQIHPLVASSFVITQALHKLLVFSQHENTQPDPTIT
jgi:hypothetical protein